MGVNAAGARLRQLREFVGVSAFELGQRSVLQNFRGQRVVVGEFFQHLFIGAARTGGGFFNDRQTEFVEKYFTQLLGRRQIKRLTCDGVSVLLELHDALAQAVALRSQGGRVDQHAIALDAVERLAAVDLQLVNEPQLVIGLQEGPQPLVYGQGEVRVFTGIVRSLGDIDLGK